MHAVTVLSAGCLILPLAAQNEIPPTLPDPATCPIKAGIKGLILEDIITGKSFQTEFIPTLSPVEIAAFSDPTKEIHTQFTFNASDMTLRAYSIPLPLGSPPLSPASTDFAGQSIAGAIVKIDKIYTICSPRPTITITGPIMSATPEFGPLVGVPHVFGFSFDPANTSYDPADRTKVNNAINVHVTDEGANAVVGYKASAIVIPATLTASVAGGPTINTMYRQNVLDGTPSVSDTGQMTYQWTAPGIDIGILDPIDPQTRIVIGGPAGDYPVTLTVSTPYESAKYTVTVHFAPKNH